jgi:hypothetical protein
MPGRSLVRGLALLAMCVALLGACTGDTDEADDPAGTTRFGPWRLIPAEYSVSHISNVASRKGFNQTDEPAEMAGSPLYLDEPIDGFTVQSVFAARVDDHPVAVTHEWDSPEGTLFVSMLEVPDEDLPIDIVREDPEKLTLTKVDIAGHDTLLVVPGEGIAPGVGAIRVWLDGTELVLGSTSFSIDQMQDFAERIVTAIDAGGGA